MAIIPSRIDPLSWAIFINEPSPDESMEQLWGYPSYYPIMRPIIHESIHFWHSISTTQGISLAFDCLKSMNALRFAAKKGINLLDIDSDWTLDNYKPFKKLQDFYIKGILQSNPFLLTDSAPKEPFLSPFHLFEGLARYWDMTISSGITTDKVISALLDKESSTYSEAYRYAYDKIGDVAFILFPLFAYLALSTDNPVFSYHYSLLNYNRDRFEIPRGINFQDAWLIAWDKAAKWEGIIPKPFGPMTTYITEHKRYVNWKLNYAGLIPEDFPFTGHPILEDSVQNMMGLARQKWPEKTDYDREAMMFVEFVFPGNPNFRKILVQAFMPPYFRFNDGRCWVSPTMIFRDKPKFFENSMNDFSVLMGAAYGFLQRAKGQQVKNKCTQNQCPLHKFGLCGYVSKYPKEYTTCSYLKLLNHEFSIG